MQTSNSSLFQISLLFPLTLVVACSLGGGPSENELVGDGDGDGAPIDRNGVGGNHSTTGGGGNAGGDGDGDTSGSGGSNSSTPPAEQCLGDSLIDDFESPLTYSLYRPYHDGTQGGVMNHDTSFAAENSSEGAGAALHLFGSGFTTWGAGIGRNFDAPLACKGRSVGLRFRAQGPGTITVAAPVTAIVPVEEGGSCTAVEACHNAHEKSVTLSATWQSYEVLWSELAQLPGWGLPATFDAKSVMEILFAARPEAMPFDFWIDDIELIDSGAPVVSDPDPDPNPGTGGGSSNEPGGCVLDGIIGEQGFLDWFSARRNAFYTYQNLCTALQGFPGFASSPDAAVNKQEVAAFFANVARETGELQYIDQIVKDPPTYYGRGPIQLTHSYNYKAAGDYLGIDLLNNPNLVSTDGVITWQTALWFWMHADGAGKGTCHGAIVGGLGFGQTINIINGGLECGFANQAAEQRIAYYQGYCADMGVAPGSNLTCW